MVRKYNRVMDKFKISFRCSKEPQGTVDLFGFEPDKAYTGRAYNGLCEVSTDWGRGKPTILLDRKIFDRYFEVVGEN
ncbi:hypothetical protein [Catalinimonas niigatensis]|uniref:hypothetical protein n=1 Tax=Catalinimonas niigatensis TaxID=1397264 RepID=UPI0026652B77|nr:hypothetical protein [Catalinimonas niigatensis]WPP52045.1 hypothetical protein PZB72_06590 [Catalinimonas niigatensis]